MPVTKYQSSTRRQSTPTSWQRLGATAVAIVFAIILIASSAAHAQSSDEHAQALKPFKVAQARYYRVYPPTARQIRRQRQRARYYRARQPRYKRRRTVRRKARRKAKPAHVVVKKNNGPIQLIVSLKRQRVTVYQNGKPITSSRISTGRDGHNTPSGVFSIIQKHRRHYSNIYRGASMPYMQRITWSGIALHAGNVPDYRASHGCIRLPYSFAKSLFRYTKMGAHVVVANGNPSPREISHAKLFRPTLPSNVVPQHRATPLVVPDMPAHLEGHQTNLVHQASLSTRGAPTVTDAIVEPEPVKPPVDAATAALMLATLEGKAARAAAYMRRSKSPIRILITRRTGRERVRDAQRLLTRLGYDTGVPDGVVGRQTVKAIKAFQTANNRNPGGHPNAQFYTDLYRLSGLKKPAAGHLYVRQNFVTIYDAPIVLNDAGTPLGTHFFMLMNFKPGETSVRWRAMTLRSRGRLRRSSRKRRKAIKSVERAPAMTALQALDRFEIPGHVRTRVSDILTPGSSMVITDKGISHETGEGTDFVVLTR